MTSFDITSPSQLSRSGSTLARHPRSGGDHEKNARNERFALACSPGLQSRLARHACRSKDLGYTLTKTALACQHLCPPLCRCDPDGRLRPLSRSGRCSLDRSRKYRLCDEHRPKREGHDLQRSWLNSPTYFSTSTNHIRVRGIRESGRSGGQHRLPCKRWGAYCPAEHGTVEVA